MREFVINLLNKGLSKSYYYHCTAHTLYVTDKVIEIGNQEKCTPEEIRILTAAAFWHDTGFTVSYANHEEESCELARENLPNFGFNQKEIDQICELIMVTQIPQTPKNKLEEIICDADLEYLGTDQVEIISENLYRELTALNPTFTKEAWNQVQISFLQKHAYFTEYCKVNKTPIKLQYLKKIIALSA